MSETDDIHELCLFLQTHTAMGRLNLRECRDVFLKLPAAGFELTKSASTDEPAPLAATAA